MNTDHEGGFPVAAPTSEVVPCEKPAGQHHQQEYGDPYISVSGRRQTKLAFLLRTCRLDRDYSEIDRPAAPCRCLDSHRNACFGTHALPRPSAVARSEGRFDRCVLPTPAGLHRRWLKNPCPLGRPSLVAVARPSQSSSSFHLWRINLSRRSTVGRGAPNPVRDFVIRAAFNEGRSDSIVRLRPSPDPP